MTKLIIQIPCYNEEETIGITLSLLPRQIEGFDEIEWLIVDDGCTDQTVEVAREHGVDHVVQMEGNKGLARAFMAGLDACVEQGADVIVNTDADNQYCADDIPKLVEPIIRREADIAVGARPIRDVSHFSRAKKLLQIIGSWVVRLTSKTSVVDAPSGFRALTREAAMRLHVFGDYTYTIETLIQAGQKGMRVVSVPIRTNEDLRPSRLVSSVPDYVMRSATTIVRIFLTYRPLALFLPLGSLAFASGFALGLRYLYLMATGSGAGHVQSVVLGTTLLGSGVFILLIGVIAELVSNNRKLLENIDWRLRELETRSRGRGDEQSFGSAEAFGSNAPVAQLAADDELARESSE